MIDDGSRRSKISACAQQPDETIICTPATGTPNTQPLDGIAVLPDILPLKEEISRKLEIVFRGRVNEYMGAINEAPRSYIKEGRQTVIIRPDGAREETQMTEASAEISITANDIPSISLQDRLRRMDAAARDIARQINEYAFDQLDQAIEAAGNVVDGAGKVLDPEAYLEVIEKMQLDFDPSGAPSELTLVIPPAMRTQAENTWRVFREDPHYRDLYVDTINRKRREWRAREASRKLVG